MKKIFHFIKNRIWVICFTTIFVLEWAVIFFLYDLPFAPLAYAIILSCVTLLFAVGFLYFQKKKKIAILKRCYVQKDHFSLHLPKPYTKEEEIYQEFIIKLHKLLIKEQEQATRAISNDDITSKICEIEFSNGSSMGRAIVSANTNFPAIIAFIPKCSSEKMMEQTGASKLLHASKASYLYNTKKMKEAVDSLRLPTLKKISKELEVPINEISYEKVKDNIVVIDAKPTTRSTAVQIGDIEMQILETSIFPLVKTNWGQEFPYNGAFGYNDLLDWVRTENGGKNYTAVPAGCVNIAMAQMMTYTHRRRIPQISFPNPDGHGSFIPNWDLMAQTPKIDDPGSSERGRGDAECLIIDLYRENHTTSKKDWDGAVIASEVSEVNMLKTMNKYFNYKPKASFNGDLAWAALRAGRLIMMLTSDHAFIISGMLITEKSIVTRQLVKNNDVYWHANLGWADECTGYYKLDSNANTCFEAKGIKEWCYKMDYLNNISVR